MDNGIEPIILDEMDSILNSIKKMHGISSDDNNFDTDIIIHINSALMVLNQLDVGPSRGFFIRGPETKWHDYITDDIIAEAIKSYVYMKVKLIFDPPSSAAMIDVLKVSIKESEWRISEWVEDKKRELEVI